MHCSTKVLRIFTDEKISPTEIFQGAEPAVADGLHQQFKRGLYYDQDSFDMSQYMRKVDRRFLLNGHGDVMTVGELLKSKFASRKFVKPGKDLKLFNGDMLEPGVTFEEYLQTKSVDDSFYNSLNEKAIVADPVDILAEWRFFVVGSDVPAHSQYRMYGEVVPGPVPSYIVDAAKKMARLYQPAECFTMDLAMTDDFQLKVVEYNCVNCSGFYDASVANLAWSLRKA